jgi:hypothetical protein
MTGQGSLSASNSRPERPPVNTQKALLTLQGFDQPHHMPAGKPRNASETLIGHPGVLAKKVGFRKDGV